MKKVLICSVLMIFLASSCLLNIGDKVKGSGNVTSEQRAVSSFDNIEIDGVFNIYLSQGDTESVTVEIDDNLQQYVIVHNKGSKLVLDTKNNINFRKVTKNNLYIIIKDIHLLDIDGVGNVETQTALRCKDLKLGIDGVGDCALELYCDRVELDYDGVRNVALRGKTVELIVDKDGVGNLNAEELEAQNVDISNSGVGNATVHASGELSISNSGVGSVTYSGGATIEKLSSSGVGKVTKAD